MIQLDARGIRVVRGERGVALFAEAGAGRVRGTRRLARIVPNEHRIGVVSPVPVGIGRLGFLAAEVLQQIVEIELAHALLPSSR